MAVVGSLRGPAGAASRERDVAADISCGILAADQAGPLRYSTLAMLSRLASRGLSTRNKSLFTAAQHPRRSLYPSVMHGDPC